ncbi:MAG: DMT family transporter [Anaerolineae bacterium]
MSGEIYALACALLWALSSALLKSQTHKIHVVFLGALRTIPALLIYWGIVLFTGRVGELLNLPVRSWAYLAGSTLIGLVVGDSIYFQSMKLIGLSRAMPLSTTYPFFTMLLSLLFLDERFGWTVIGGAVLIAGGGYLLALHRGKERLVESQAVRRINSTGVVLALCAALCWSISTVLLRVGLEKADTTLANVVRLSVLMVALFAMTLKLGKIERVKAYGARSLGIVFLAGIVGTGLGTFTFLTAVQRAGAARTSILTATTPLFGVPFSLLLKERPSSRTLVGTSLTMVGVWLTLW